MPPRPRPRSRPRVVSRPRARQRRVLGRPGVLSPEQVAFRKIDLAHSAGATPQTRTRTIGWFDSFLEWFSHVVSHLINKKNLLEIPKIVKKLSGLDIWSNIIPLHYGNQYIYGQFLMS